MATLTASKVASTVQPRAGIDVTAVYATYTLTAALALNDVIEMVKVPTGATVLDVVLGSADLDSNATPLIALDVGDGSDTNRFISSSTIGQTGGVGRLSNQVGLNYTYSADDTIDILVSAAPATGATSGDVDLMVLYTMAQ